MIGAGKHHEENDCLSTRRGSAMSRGVCLAVCVAAAVLPSSIVAQEAGAGADQPAWLEAIVFLVSLPYTLYLVLVEGQRMHLLPVPLLAIGFSLWSFLEWKRQRFWTPRIIHILAVLGLATIVMINVAWVQAGGEMWTQRYVVIAVFGLFPYIAYLLFLGPKFLGRRRAPAANAAPEESLAELAGSGRTGDDFSSPAPTSRPRPVLRRVLGYGAVLGIGLVGLVFAATLAPVSDVRSDLDELRNAESLTAMGYGVAKGDPGARVTIVEFGDYQCPGCGTFALHHEPLIDSAFVETGRARFIFFDLPLTTIHAHAFLAARASRCAEEQDGYWEYQGALFRNQATWSELTTPHDAFEQYAGSVGLDPVAFRACLGSDRHTDVVRGSGELARRLGIRGTPTVIVMVDGGEIRELRRDTFRAISATIEEMVGSVR